MKYLDICSGISAPTMAWKPLGWEALCFAEIEAAPRAVLAHHYPDVPLVGDFTQIRGDEYGSVDLLVGGTPCQSFSVAGLRGGLADERGNLALEYLRLADRSRPRWLVWENVPGVLSSGGGGDFGTFLGGLAQLGYGFAYAVLDAQHFGVPQRRRRVFVVGYLGDWRRAAAVLFERHSLQGHPAPRREAGQRIANSLTERPDRGGGNSEGQRLIPQGCGGETAPTINAAFGSKLGLDNQHIDSGCGLFVAHSLRAEGFDASEDGTGRGTPLVPVAFDWQSGGDARGLDPKDTAQLQRSQVPAVAFNITPSNSNRDYNARESERAQALTAGGNRPSARGGDLIADTLTSNGDAHSGYRDEKGLVGHASAVRRLTPRECERLQGFPDDFTLVPYRKGMMADGPRYKMLGNSMAVPVVRWIGERIARVDAIAQTEARAA